LHVHATPYFRAVRAAEMALPVPIRVLFTNVSDQGRPIILIAFAEMVPSKKDWTYWGSCT
jgi:hypothetical protein